MTENGRREGDSSSAVGVATAAANTTLHLRLHDETLRVLLRSIVVDGGDGDGNGEKGWAEKDDDGRRAYGSVIGVRGRAAAASSSWSSSSSEDDGVGKEDDGETNEREDGAEGDDAKEARNGAGEEEEDISSSSADDDVDGNNDESSTGPVAASVVGARGPRQQRRVKLKGGSSGVDDLVRRIGPPPSVLLPLPPGADDDADDDEDDAATTTKVLDVPAALLPRHRRQDAAGRPWDAVPIARTLLSLADDITTANVDRTIVVLLLRSGRFAGAIFRGIDGSCLVHRVCVRYTVRRGQGGSQASNDASKGKAKSMGAQLRRAGEVALRNDVAETLSSWRHHVENASIVWLSCPKPMRGGLHSTGDISDFLPRDDDRIRSVPFDYGRPTFEAACAVHQSLTTIVARGATEAESKALKGAATVAAGENMESGKTTMAASATAGKREEEALSPEPVPATPLTPLHEAAAASDLPRLMELLALDREYNDNEGEDHNGHDAHGQCDGDGDVDARAGPDELTPLHLAAAAAAANGDDPSRAASCVSALLLTGRANPCVVDKRGRPPYYVASHDKVRDAFRAARAELGEVYCDWDGGKVGPPLTADAERDRKAKAAEKKRRQRARQKERKAKEKAEAEGARRKAAEEERRKKEEEDAKRIRDGLKPKAIKADNVCDFCQKVCKGKRRAQMFHRLEYAYCGTECVKKHQRELMAAAAAARMGG